MSQRNLNEFRGRTNQMVDLSAAIHVGPCSAMNALPRECDSIALQDMLCMGPCHADPTTHFEKRVRYWSEVSAAIWEKGASRQGKQPRRSGKTTYQQSDDGARLIDLISTSQSHRPVVLWSAREWTDRLGVWWASNLLKVHVVDVSRIWLAESQTPERGEGEDETVSCHGADLMQQAFQRAERMGNARLRDGAAIWRMFARPSPLAFDRRRRLGSSSFPDLGVISEGYRFYMPRAMDGRLILSEFDQFLLEHLGSKRRVRPYDVVIEFLNNRPLVAWCPALLINYRIRSWERHSQECPVLLGKKIDGVNTLNDMEYELTNRGKEIRDRGIKASTEAPPMNLGGVELYQGRSPWVREGNRDDWQIKRFQETSGH
ncbi:MAG: DUF1835 domain-containing protein [Planctomycetota bacterium]